MFNRNSRRAITPDVPANKALNKILTYGLIFFIIYTLYQKSNYSHAPHDFPGEVNYTPINWGDYVKITNLLDGSSNLQNLSNNPLVLEMTPDDLDKLNEKENTQIYKLEFGDATGVDQLISQ